MLEEPPLPTVKLHIYHMRALTSGVAEWAQQAFRALLILISSSHSRFVS